MTFSWTGPFTLGKNGMMISADDGATWKTVPQGFTSRWGSTVVRRLGLQRGGWHCLSLVLDCGNVVRTGAIWRFDLVPPPDPAN
jgi:hypothetical protein